MSKSKKSIEKVTDIKPKDFFDKRMLPLGITEDGELNKIKIDHQNGSFFEHKIFTRVPEGIRILVYTIDGHLINYKEERNVNVDEKGFDVESRKWAKNYSITRLEHPKIKKNGDEQKYNLPKEQLVVPFFPPKLVEFYRTKTKRHTLYLTEGYFKAFHSTNNGIDCVGIPSIYTLKNKETGKLHDDIVKLILTCEYERVVWLVDGDCRNITSKEIKDGLNLSKRPNSFFQTIITAHELLSSYSHLILYFSCINTYNLEKRSKGIDDLLIDYPENAQKIESAFNDFGESLEALVGNLLR